ncbi:MAG: hypothetical protein ACE5WD_02195 [Candidatus Aminicenantia bacterium]
MWIFNNIWGKIFEFLFFPFKSIHPWYGMIFISFLTGLLMLFIFRYTSNQEGIRKVKNRIKAHLLEIRLFKDDLGLMFKAQKNILQNNLIYMKYSLKPMLVMIIPLILILIQLNLWFSQKPLEPNQSAIVILNLQPNVSPIETSVKIRTPEGVSVETPALRIMNKPQINWRIRAEKYGQFNIEFETSETKLNKKLIVSPRKFIKLSSKKVSKNFIDEIVYPGEPPLPRNPVVRSIEIKYPPARLNFLGLKIHWLIAFFVLSILFGFSLKRFFKVEI